MTINAKEILIIFIGIVGSAIIGLVIKILDFQSESLNFFGWILIIVFVSSFLIVLIYKRLNELNDDLEKQKEKYVELDKRLIRHEQLINLEARIIALENKNG